MMPRTWNHQDDMMKRREGLLRFLFHDTTDWANREDFVKPAFCRTSVE
jgi:hypothetical protein